MNKLMLFTSVKKKCRNSLKRTLLVCISPLGFPSGSEVKASACSVGDLGLIPGSGRSPGEGNGNPLQYSCLENPVDRGAWWATVHGVSKSWTRLSDLTSLSHCKLWPLYVKLLFSLLGFNQNSFLLFVHTCTYFISVVF